MILRRSARATSFTESSAVSFFCAKAARAVRSQSRPSAKHVSGSILAAQKGWHGLSSSQAVLRGRLVCSRATSEATKAGDSEELPPGDEEPEALVLLVACCIGLATGGGVVLFNDAIHAIQEVAWGPVLLSQGGEWARSMSKTNMGPSLWPLIIAPPVAGGIIVSLLKLAFGDFEPAANPPKPRSTVRRKLSPSDEALARATYQTTREFDPGDQAMQGSSLLVSEWSAPLQKLRSQAQSLLQPFIKAAAAAVSLGTGASLGPEGPSVEIGKAVAERLGGTLRSQRRHITSLVAAGSGAGVAAGFNAPIAGVFFAVETVLRRQPESEEGDESSGVTIAMVLLASVLAAVVSQAGLGAAPAFRVPTYQLASPLELPLFLVFGILCGAVSSVFTYSAKVSTAAFNEVRQLGIPGPYLPVLGGLVTGLVAVLYPEVLYQGFNNVNAVLRGGHIYATGLLIQILVAKILVTSVCRGSGLVGGIYAPSIFQGATLGSAFGCIVSDTLTPLGFTIAEPQVYALVGVAAMLAANCRVPLTSVLLLFELTRDYYLIIPCLASVGLSFWAVQYCLRAIARLASEAPDFKADARADEGPPFEVQSDVPYLSLASILTFDETEAEGSSDAEIGSVPAHVTARLDSQVRQAMDASPSSVLDLTVQCAVEDSCLIFYESTTMSDALQAFDDTGQQVGMVTGEDGEVKGVLTRESVVRALKGLDSPQDVG